jgi:hypothetical protein
MRRISSLIVLCLLYTVSAFSQQSFNTRVLLIPLDDRPPCLQFTEKMGLIGNTEVISPPKEYLGKFTKAGDPDKIIEWIRKQDLQSFNAVIISMDMLAYGGLVASRVHQTNEDIALARIKIITEIRKKAPKVPLYGQSVVMRLAPTSDGKNEAYREKLARWADISPYPENSAETAQLEKDIPAEALNNYKTARKRNLAINMEAVNLVEKGILNYLIFSQDDAKPKGIHVADREKLISEVKSRNLSAKVLVQPGTDETSMLLLSRALNTIYKFSPKVFVKFSSEQSANTAMPFEDRPLRTTVSYDIAATGATEVTDESKADLLFYVFASRFDAGSADKFAAEVETKINAGKKVMVADVDPRGNTQGGDTGFTDALLKLKVFPELYSYASWNTAGNTIGTAIPQGLIFDLGQTKLSKQKVTADKILAAQSWFTFHRVMDDYYFHTLVRKKANEFFNQSNRSGFERTEDVARQVEKYANDLLQVSFTQFASNFAEKRPGSKLKAICKASNMTFILPWNRTFEAEINFDLSCRL